MENIVANIKRAFKFKLFLSVVFLISIVPFVQIMYWQFETAYFGHFGISPEIFNRPVFSSGFISVWLFATSLYPIFLAWSLFMLVVFICLLVVESKIYLRSNDASRLDPLHDSKPNNVGPVDDAGYFWKAINFFEKVVGKSLNMPFAVWALGLLILLGAVILFLSVSAEGIKLAQKQLDNYLHPKRRCIDGISGRNVGCYTIEGVEGNNLLVLTNTETHLIYLSPTNFDITKDKSEKLSAGINVHIVEKQPGQTFTIIREYKAVSEL